MMQDTVPLCALASALRKLEPDLVVERPARHRDDVDPALDGLLRALGAG